MRDAMVGVIGALVGAIVAMANGVGKHKNESAEVAIAGLKELVALQQQTITAMQAKILYLEAEVERLRGDET